MPRESPPAIEPDQDHKVERKIRQLRELLALLEFIANRGSYGSPI
jgi:hypothetical protein